ncbi:hypothetical protein [Bradyrhizobium sp. USDA 4011]
MRTLLKPEMAILNRAVTEALDPAVAKLPPCSARDRVIRAVKAIKRDIRRLPRSIARHRIDIDDADAFKSALATEVGRLVATFVEIVELCRHEGKRFEN